MLTKTDIMDFFKGVSRERGEQENLYVSEPERQPYNRKFEIAKSKFFIGIF